MNDTLINGVPDYAVIGVGTAIVITWIVLLLAYAFRGKDKK